MITWTYLINKKYSSTISTLLQNPLTFEYVEIDDKIKLNNLTNGYIDLRNECFFDSFSDNYNMLFISQYNPTENPIKREKMFEMELKFSK